MSRIIRTRDSRGPSFAAHRHARSGQSPDDLAAQIVERARTKADEMLAEAEAAAAALRSAAEREIAEQQAALAAEGQRQLHGNLESSRQLLASVVHELRERQHQWLAAWQHESLELALAIAGRILRREIPATSDLAVQLVRESLELAAGAATVTVRVNPIDLSRWRADLESLLHETHPIAKTNLLGDPHVSTGGCRLETEFGGIDQTVEAQLQRIAEELRHDC